MTKILFLSHDFSRSGAPLTLLELIECLVDSNFQFDFDVFAIKGGALSSKFEEIGGNKVGTFENRPGYYTRILRKLKLEKPIPGEIVSTKYDLIFANSIASLAKSIELKEHYKAKLFLYLHEDRVFSQMILDQVSLELLNQVDFIIAASESVRKNVINTYGFLSERTMVLYPVMGMKPLKWPKLSDKRKNKVIGSLGHVHMIKGYDFFLQVALLSARADLPYKFQWVGGINNDLRVLLKSDVEKYGIENVEFLGASEAPESAMKEFDLGLILSREESFSRFAFQMALGGKTFCCFSNCGGISDLAQRLGAPIFPFGDFEAVFRFINDFLNGDVKLNELQQTIRLNALDMHKENLSQIEKLAQVITEAVNN